MKNKNLTSGLVALSLVGTTVFGVSCTQGTEDLGTSIYQSDKDLGINNYKNDTYSPDTKYINSASYKNYTTNGENDNYENLYRFTENYVMTDNYTQDNNPYKYDKSTLSKKYNNSTKYDNNETNDLDTTSGDILNDTKKYWSDTDYMKYQDEMQNYEPKDLGKYNKYTNRYGYYNNRNITDYEDYETYKKMNSYNYKNDLIDTSLIDDYKTYGKNDNTTIYRNNSPIVTSKKDLPEDKEKEKMKKMIDEVEMKTEEA